MPDSFFEKVKMPTLFRDHSIKVGIKSDHRHQLVAFDGNFFLKESMIFRL